MKKYIVDSFQSRGHFGQFGGRYVPEMLVPALERLEQAYLQARSDPAFQAELDMLLKTWSGRPTPLYFAENLSHRLGGARVYLKQEGLGQTGSHKVNNCLGQALLARRMGKKRLIAETGAGQHGLATATVAARFGFACEIFMGELDMARQRPNVFWMQQLGAKVTPVTYGARTLKEACNESLKNWIENLEDTYLLVGSALSAHPYPSMVRDFQSVIGREVRAQLQEAEGRLPDCLIACVGGGSNSIGLFHPFLEEQSVRLVGVEAGGFGIPSGQHSARFQGGKLGIIEGYKSYFLQNEDGQTLTTHSVAAGLDYAGVGPEHAFLHDLGRVEYVSATDSEVLEALKLLMRTEGIIPALESAHAVAEAVRRVPGMRKDQVMVVNLSGRGDKDIFIVAEALKDEEWLEFLRQKVKAGYDANKIDTRLEALKAGGAHGLMAHIVVGYPSLAASERLLLALADSGADLIELQIPFTDPLADGPTILRANLASLAAGTRVRDCLEFAGRMTRRLENVPLLFMTYINIPFNYGIAAFCRDSASAGISGLIVPDIPPEESSEGYHASCTASGLHPIHILSPSSTAERIRLIGAQATGFVYCTARVGITGARERGLAGLADFTTRVRARVKVPLALGFGLSSREHVDQVRPLVDISVIGSRVIDLYNRGADEKESLADVSAFIRSLR